MSNWKITGPPRFVEGIGMVYPVTRGGNRFNASEEDELKALLSGWVSINEKLPPFKAPVITFSPDMGTNIDELYRAENFDSENRMPCFFEGDRDGAVTHWMPIPSPPTN
ncbi:MAG: DUF551 domain-containing protein [Halomonas sp.]|nr:DUF551 domain-containing protein [Halomonas sp.]MCC5904071.1 DUF551 domain-containing protein [Halomonas sp.]